MTGFELIRMQGSAQLLKYANAYFIWDVTLDGQSTTLVPLTQTTEAAALDRFADWIAGE